MKALGIVRNIDNLGRLCLPMEIRKTMELPEYTPMEFYVDRDAIIIKKYGPGCVFCGGMKISKTIGSKNICTVCVDAIRKGV